eukprot:a174975_535.p1 GENE.a174975_535~~a174975_535.p1  ORF type:complete len:388 (+),score=152.59 a174975_535:34-1164(+)
MGNKGSKGEKKKGKKGKDAVSSASEEEDEPTIFGGRVTKDDFDNLSVLGKGSFGKVLLVRKKDNQQVYAMKILLKSMLIERNQVDHTKAERDILKMIRHPFIVQLHYAFQTEDKLYMVLDYINGGELFFHLKRCGRFPEGQVLLYAAEITSALAFVHSLNIIYRDLKPENLLLDSEGHIRITDFGLSKQFKSSEERTETFCGTPEYLAPEILRGEPHGAAVDWWSLGTLLWELLSGLPPFYSQNTNAMYQRILTGALAYPDYFQPETKAILAGFLTRPVAERLGSTGADAVKSHPYFASIDWAKLDAKGYKPDFVPPVKGADDTSQIDTAFTKEAAVDSPVEKQAISNVTGNEFGGFTFVPDSALGGASDAPAGPQ